MPVRTSREVRVGVRLPGRGDSPRRARRRLTYTGKIVFVDRWSLCLQVMFGCVGGAAGVCGVGWGVWRLGAAIFSDGSRGFVGPGRLLAVACVCAALFAVCMTFQVPGVRAHHFSDADLWTVAVSASKKTEREDENSGAADCAVARAEPVRQRHVKTRR